MHIRNSQLSIVLSVLNAAGMVNAAFTCSGSGCQTACQSDCQLISTLYTSMFPGQANPYLSGTPNCNCCTAGGGVTCNSVTGRIDQLQWQNKWGRVQNAGTVPNDTFCALSSVVNVVFSDNKLTGSIPDCGSAYFPGLTQFDFSNNFFTGSLPSFAGYYPKLIALNVANNQLSGPISSAMNLSFPAESPESSFNVAFNNLNDNLPATAYCKIFNTVGNIDLSVNGFTGALPLCEGSIPPILTSIKVRNNQLSGSIPAGIFNSRITTVDFSKNLFTGSWSTVEVMSSLTYIDLNTNGLTGNLPAGIVGSIITTFDVSHNNFQGSFPTSFFGQDSGLALFNLAHNSFSGEIPNLFFSETGPNFPSSSILGIHLNDNAFTGGFPSTITDWALRLNLGVGLQIHLENNQLSGPAPGDAGSAYLIFNQLVMNINGNGFCSPLGSAFSIRAIFPNCPITVTANTVSVTRTISQSTSITVPQTFTATDTTTTSTTLVLSTSTTTTSSSSTTTTSTSTSVDVFPFTSTSSTTTTATSLTTLPLTITDISTSQTTQTLVNTETRSATLTQTNTQSATLSQTSTVQTSVTRVSTLQSTTTQISTATKTETNTVRVSVTDTSTLRESVTTTETVVKSTTMEFEVDVTQTRVVYQTSVVQVTVSATSSLVSFVTVAPAVDRKNVTVVVGSGAYGMDTSGMVLGVLMQVPFLFL